MARYVKLMEIVAALFNAQHKNYEYLYLDDQIIRAERASVCVAKFYMKTESHSSVVMT